MRYSLLNIYILIFMNALEENYVKSDNNLSFYN